MNVRLKALGLSAKQFMAGTLREQEAFATSVGGDLRGINDAPERRFVQVYGLNNQTEDIDVSDWVVDLGSGRLLMLHDSVFHELFEEIKVP